MDDPDTQSNRPFNTQPSILHDEPEWFVLNKPICWHCVLARVTDGNPTIQDWLGESDPRQRELPECGLVHRLDHSTSGCILVAKNVQMHETLRENFSVGFGGWAIEKRYLALVGSGLDLRGEFALYFAGRHKGSAKVSVHAYGDRAERGECRWTVVRKASAMAKAGDPLSFDLVEVEVIGPGRRHQIRAGLSSLGHPLAGDSLYKGIALGEDWNGGCAALHSWRLGITGIRVESPIPAWAE